MPFVVADEKKKWHNFFTGGVPQNTWVCDLRGKQKPWGVRQKMNECGEKTWSRFFSPWHFAIYDATFGGLTHFLRAVSWHFWRKIFGRPRVLLFILASISGQIQKQKPRSSPRFAQPCRLKQKNLRSRASGLARSHIKKSSSFEIIFRHLFSSNFRLQKH